MYLSGADSVYRYGHDAIYTLFMRRTNENKCNDAATKLLKSVQLKQAPIPTMIKEPPELQNSRLQTFCFTYQLYQKYHHVLM